MFDALLFYFVYQNIRHPTEQFAKFRPFVYGIAASSAFVVMRSLYRVIEMGIGWDGVVNRTEWPLYVFDGAFVFIAVMILSVYHPGRFLPQNFSWKRSAYDYNGDDKRAPASEEAKDVDSPEA